MVTEYFTPKEKTCHCGCGLNLVDKAENRDFLMACNTAREFFGEPIDANCMTRCDKHNREGGGVDGSAHKDGRGIDADCHDPNKRVRMVKSFMRAGFERFELSGVHVHADMKRGAPAVMLIKTKNGMV